MRVRLKLVLAFILTLAAVIVGVRAGIIAYAEYVMADFASSMCGSTLLRELPSPDATLRAVVYERNCGATTGFATHVSLLGPDDSAGAEAGNVLVADTDRGRAPAGPGGGPAVLVRWLGPRELEVQHHPAARTFAADTLVAGVRIRYVKSAKQGV